MTPKIGSYLALDGAPNRDTTRWSVRQICNCRPRWQICLFGLFSTFLYYTLAIPPIYTSYLYLLAAPNEEKKLWATGAGEVIPTGAPPRGNIILMGGITQTPGGARGSRAV